MNRFERRVGQRSSSPKPGGVPVCKLPKKNNRVMLSGFIDVNEKGTSMQQSTMQQSTMQQSTMQQSTMQQSTKSNSIIEDITNEAPKYVDSKIKKIMNVNEELKNLIRKTPDKNIRLILGHEIRLNTIELNIDCLNDMKCEKIYEEQQLMEKDQKILINSRKVDQIEILVKETLFEVEKKKELLEINEVEINNNITNNVNEINIIKETLEKYQLELTKNEEDKNKLNNNLIENKNTMDEKFKHFNEEIRKRDNIINNLKLYNFKVKSILEKMMSKSKKTELTTDLNELDDVDF